MTTRCAAVISDLDRVGMDGLHDKARGSAYVESIDVQSDQTLVRLAYPFGRHLEVAVPRTGSTEQQVGIRRPLAVQVRSGADEVQCSVLDSAEAGPTRVSISLDQALTLAGSGVHTVFLSE